MAETYPPRLLNRVTILGSGTCFADPRIPDPRKHPRRAHPGFLLSYASAPDAAGGRTQHHLLLDCSQGIADRLEAMREHPLGAHEIRQVAISHAHPDHFAWPHFLQAAFCRGMQAPGFSWEDPAIWPRLTLFAPGHVVRHLPLLNALSFEETTKGDGSVPLGLDFPVVHAIGMTGNAGPLPLEGGATIEALPLYHGFGKVDALGFRVTLPSGHVFAYSGDAGTCDNLLKLARGADCFVCEAAARVGDEGAATGYGHLTPAQAGQIAQETGVDCLVLTHYSGADTEEDLLRDAVRTFRERRSLASLIIAKDGHFYDFVEKEGRKEGRNRIMSEQRRYTLSELPQETIVAWVNNYQRSKVWHPLTCGNDSGHPELVAQLENGKAILACPQEGCGYRQAYVPPECVVPPEAVRRQRLLLAIPGHPEHVGPTLWEQFERARGWQKNEETATTCPEGHGGLWPTVEDGNRIILFCAECGHEAPVPPERLATDPPEPTAADAERP